VKRGRRYRHDIEQRLVQDDGVEAKCARYAAGEVEKAVLAILRRFPNSPAEIVAALAFLSPPLVRRIRDGEQPVGTTKPHLLRCGTAHNIELMPQG
jgi:hypothetical protein